MKDERMAMSEALYGFLTPTPEYFQQPAQEKKSSQFLKSILKRYTIFACIKVPYEWVHLKTVLITYENGKVSGEPSHSRSLTGPSAFRSYNKGELEEASFKEPDL